MKHRRLNVLKTTQEAIVAASGDSISQTEISRIERGKKHPWEDLPAPKFLGLLRGFRWDLEEFKEDTGIDVPVADQAHLEAMVEAQYLVVHPNYLRFDVFAGTSAGESDPDPIEGEAAFISVEKLKAKGAEPRDVVVYRVNGDCMVSTEARQIERNIAHGDFIAVDTRRRPQPGDTVVAWWADDEKLVVKRYRVEREGVLLYPMKPGHPTLVLKHEDDAKIIGVVIWREG